MNFDHPQTMGILNITPDSFSDGGQLYDNEKGAKLNEIEQRVTQMIESGADIIDIGGESTGPGSKDVSQNDELERVKSIIDLIAEKQSLFSNVQDIDSCLRRNDSIVFSIDTYKAKVAEYALQIGFEIVNDVTALRGDPEMIDVLLKYKPYVILMYSKDDTPRTTTKTIEYEDVLQTIKDFLTERIEHLTNKGFPREKIIIDPGMGMFVSANPDYSFEIIERLNELTNLGCPILIGVSRKSFLGGELKDRDLDSVKYSLEAIQNGADIVRIHNVKFMSERLSSFYL
jgi:dihydropteroate synthase